MFDLKNAEFFSLRYDDSKSIANIEIRFLTSELILRYQINKPANKKIFEDHLKLLKQVLNLNFTMLWL
jgi:hypothetical protein